MYVTPDELLDFCHLSLVSLESFIICRPCQDYNNFFFFFEEFSGQCVSKSWRNEKWKDQYFIICPVRTCDLEKFQNNYLNFFKSWSVLFQWNTRLALTNKYWSHILSSHTTCDDLTRFDPNLSSLSHILIKTWQVLIKPQLISEVGLREELSLIDLLSIRRIIIQSSLIW